MCYPITTETAVKEYSFIHLVEHEDNCHTIQDISKLYHHTYLDAPKNTEQVFVFETIEQLDTFLMEVYNGTITPDDFYPRNPYLWLFRVTKQMEVIGYMVVC